MHVTLIGQVKTAARELEVVIDMQDRSPSVVTTKTLALRGHEQLVPMVEARPAYLPPEDRELTTKDEDLTSSARQSDGLTVGATSRRRSNEGNCPSPSARRRIVDVAIPVLFSWSAGKDSAFGLWTLLRDQTYEVRTLLTTVTEGYDRVSMSGVREDLLDRQADVLGLPLHKVKIPPACPNEVYEERMASALASEALAGIDHVAFSDLFLEDVRAYREERLGWVGKRGVFPLWGRDTSELAREMVMADFRAVVVCVDLRALDGSFAGRGFDTAFLDDLPDGVDHCGENGEFHTFVWDAPMYRGPIPCRTGEVVTRDGFVYCDVLSA